MYLIGITGGSASGKSTLAIQLQTRLSQRKVKIFHMDAYFKEESHRPDITGPWNRKTYRDDNHPDSIDWDRFHKDFDAACAEDWDVIIIEGLFAFWDEAVYSKLNLKLYVDCNDDERFARRIKRNLGYGQDFEEITDRYVHAVQPRHREYVEPGKWKADLIVNGFETSPLTIEIIVSWIEKFI